MKTISRYLMTLVALFAMTTGAWANIATIEFTKETMPGSWRNNFTLISPDYLPDFKPANDAEAIAWDGASKTNKTILIYGFDGEKVKSVLFNPAGGYQTRNEISTLYDFYEQVMVNDYKVCYTTFGVFLNDTKTEASFDMPTYDLTVDYELVRDMTYQVNAYVGTDPEAEYRHRVVKVSENLYMPADITDEAQIIALFPVIDVIDAQNPKALTYGTDYTVTIVDAEQNEIAVSEFSFAPGTYTVKVTGKGDYDGQIASANEFTLFQGYEVTVPAGEFATFYKDENLYADPVTSADAKIYTITAVEDDQATLTELTTAAANTPLLVQNTSADTKTFLLIPTDDAGDNVTVYTGFVGTLVDATIAASTEAQTNYAFNGKQFVFVKDDLAVAANRAWLEVPAVISNAKAITLVFGDATGLKAIDNGQLTIDNGDWYDLNGRKLNGMPTKKGVYIMNGKKVVVK